MGAKSRIIGTNGEVYNTLLNSRFTKHQKKRIRKMIASMVLMGIFLLFSICFGDMVFSMRDELSGLLQDPLLSIQQPTDINATIYDDSVDTNINDLTMEWNAVNEALVFYSENGSRYHANATCSGMKEVKETNISFAKSMGFVACKRCNPLE